MSIPGDTVHETVMECYKAMNRRGGNLHFAIFRHEEETSSIIVE